MITCYVSQVFSFSPFILIPDLLFTNNRLWCVQHFYFTSVLRSSCPLPLHLFFFSLSLLLSRSWHICSFCLSCLNHRQFSPAIWVWHSMWFGCLSLYGCLHRLFRSYFCFWTHLASLLPFPVSSYVLSPHNPFCCCARVFMFHPFWIRYLGFCSNNSKDSQTTLILCCFPLQPKHKHINFLDSRVYCAGSCSLHLNPLYVWRTDSLILCTHSFVFLSVLDRHPSFFLYELCQTSYTITSSIAAVGLSRRCPPVLSPFPLFVCWAMCVVCDSVTAHRVALLWAPFIRSHSPRSVPTTSHISWLILYQIICESRLLAALQLSAPFALYAHMSFSHCFAFSPFFLICISVYELLFSVCSDLWVARLFSFSCHPPFLGFQFGLPRPLLHRGITLSSLVMLCTVPGNAWENWYWQISYITHLLRKSMKIWIYLKLFNSGHTRSEFFDPFSYGGSVTQASLPIFQLQSFDSCCISPRPFLSAGVFAFLSVLIFSSFGFFIVLSHLVRDRFSLCSFPSD